LQNVPASELSLVSEGGERERERVRTRGGKFASRMDGACRKSCMFAKSYILKHFVYLEAGEIEFICQFHKFLSPPVENNKQNETKEAFLLCLLK
jgi:hypothetical protein